MGSEPKWARHEQDVNGRPIIRSNYDYLNRQNVAMRQARALLDEPLPWALESTTYAEDLLLDRLSRLEKTLDLVLTGLGWESEPTSTKDGNP